MAGGNHHAQHFRGGGGRDHPFKRLLRFGPRYAWLTCLVCHHTAGGQATYFRNRCVSYGFEPGTPTMAQCIQNESISSRGRASARANAAFANMQNSQPKTTTCNRFGNTVNCTTF